MAFYREGDTLVSDTKKVEYEILDPFKRVLRTLPADEAVPRGLVMLGILTEQLVPRKGDQADHVEIVVDKIESAPAADVLPSTVRGIQWLLSEIGDSLEADRKTKIGTLIDEAHLHTPERPARQSEDAHITHDTKENKSDPTDYSSEPSKGDTDTSCEFCGDDFDSERSLKYHKIQCDSKPPDEDLICQYCGNKYISKRALNEHLESCDGSNQAAPDQSLNPTTSTNGSRKNTIYECNECGAKFSTKKFLEHHANTCTDGFSKNKNNVTGVISNFNSRRGYGFITHVDKEGEHDVFFHINEYPGRNPEEGERLEFDMEPTEEGPQASNISIVRKDSPDPFDTKFASKRPRWGKDS